MRLIRNNENDEQGEVRLRVARRKREQSNNSQTRNYYNARSNEIYSAMNNDST